MDLPLVFETEPLEGVVVQWMTDQPDVLNSAGQIADSFAEEAGELVQVRAVIACQQEEAVYTREVMVYPLRKTDGEAFRRKTDHALEKADQESLQEEGFSLPEQIDGENVTFRKRAGKEFCSCRCCCFWRESCCISAGMNGSPGRRKNGGRSCWRIIRDWSVS